MRIKSFRKEKSKQFYFRIFDKNEKQILRSEAYNSKAARDNGIASFKKNSASPDMYERKVASDGSFFFNLKAANGQVVSTSVMFKTEDEREAVIKAILDYASGAGNSKASSKPAGDSAKEQDDYMAAAFYQDSGSGTTSGFDKFQKGAANLHYFSFKSDDGKVLLLSQGYTAEAGRDNGIASVEKNSKNEDRFVTNTEGGKYYFILKAGNHQEIAKSVNFDSAEDMTRAISIIMAGEGSFAPPAMTKASSASSAGNSDSKEQDDYMGLDFYQSSGTDTGSGFDKFQNGDAGLHYFSFKSDDGKVLLMSQGYTAEAGRDNGISSVEKNGKLEERYTAHSEDGKFFFTIKAGNHQEIAKSVNFDSEEDMARAINIVRSGGGSMAPEMVKASSAASADASDSKGGLDEYMGLDFYRSNASGDGFNRFENDGNHYFTYNGGNDVILFSQAYTAEAGRDNGIASVTKNAPIEKRYAVHNENGKYYFTLKAGNHQEIGRSREYDSEADMKAAMGLMMAAGGGGAVTSRSASSASSESSSSSSSSSSAESVALASSGVAAGAVGGGMVKSSSKTTKTEKEDDYLPCKEYEGHTVNDKVNNVAFFKHKNGQFYFVVYKEDGSVRLRSEGFESAKERDVELSGLLKNINNPDMYSSIKSGKYAIHILKDADGREVGRSCLEKEEEAKPEVVEEAPVEAIAATAVAGAAATTVVTSETKTEKEDDYLPCKAYEGHTVNDKVNGVAFFKHENGQYYFVVYKEDGSVRLRSEGFESAKERDVELSGMLKNINNQDMYTTIKRGKYSIHILKDETGREVGRSCLEKEEEAAPAVVEETPVVETVAAAAAVGGAAAVVSKETSKEKEDDYLPCKAYEGHEVYDKTNNIAFFRHENGQYYFVVYKADGSVRLRSEGFESAKAKNEELKGVIKHLNNPDMYSTIKRGKYSIQILKDETGREVGRSCLEKEVEAAPVVVEETPVEAVAATAVAGAAAASVVTSETKTEKEDDYLPCKAYEGHNVNDKENGVAFFKHENGQYYFVVYKEDGSVRLRSEGFESAKERDVELSGMLKNLNKKEMYSTIKRGKYSIHILKDADGREVGRSCLEKEEEVAPVVVEETSTVETVAATAAAGAVAATVVSSSTPEPPAPVDKEDDYLPCKEYEGHKISDKKNRVAFFKHENGQYYFAIYNPDGSVRLRSEGFRTVQQRDSELSGAVKGLNNKDMYETLRKGKYFMNVLKDKTGREVGRSCLQKEETPVVPKEAVAVAAAAVAAPVVKEVIKKKKVEIEDDYLPCKAYEGHKVTDKKNNIAFFKHENGQHYFVVYKQNGKVKLRSEGFPSKEDMQGELKAVIKHMKTKRNYSKIEAQGGKYVIHVLKDDKGKEVGRSCLEKVKKAAPVVASAAAAAAVAATTVKKVETVEEVIEPVPVVKETAKKVVATTAAKAAVGGATAKAAATTAATGGGFKWWWLLPLLLLPLLFFWFKGCGGETTAVVAPPVKEVVAEKPAPEPEPVKEVAPPPAPSCNCSGRSNSPVFNLPSNAIPKSLTRLGTSPEFGNSHGMSASQFFNKLKGAAGANGRDKQFLDQVFKAMGYGGFSDATADMFSEVRLSPGTTGNMGFGGSKHRTIYATINTSGRDLEAFKIKAANGCHLHFMKTCGNHFFFCPN